MANRRDCTVLKTQIPMPTNEPLCCTAIIAFLTKKYIRELFAIAWVAQWFHPLFLKTLLASLIDQKSRSFCGSTNDRCLAHNFTSKQSKSEIADGSALPGRGLKNTFEFVTPSLTLLYAATLMGERMYSISY